MAHTMRVSRRKNKNGIPVAELRKMDCECPSCAKKFKVNMRGDMSFGGTISYPMIICPKCHVQYITGEPVKVIRIVGREYLRAK